MNQKGRIFPRSFEGQAPKEFGMDANILKTRTFTLTVARSLEEIEVGGSCIWAISASSLQANIDIYINDQLRDPVTFRQGMFIRGIPFSRVFVSHAAQAGATITIFFAVEEEVNNIQIVNPSLAYNEVNVTKSTQVGTYADVVLGAAGQTVIRAANYVRRELFVTNLAGNASILRLGNAGVAAAQGIELAPGETIAFATTGALYAWNPGAIQSVGVIELSD